MSCHKIVKVEVNLRLISCGYLKLGKQFRENYILSVIYVTTNNCDNQSYTAFPFYFNPFQVLHFYPAGAVAGSCILLVSSFLFLATRLFHILPHIRFWPNLIKVTSILITTLTLKMVASGVTMGVTWVNKLISPKRHQILQITQHWRVTLPLDPQILIRGRNQFSFFFSQ